MSCSLVGIVGTVAPVRPSRRGFTLIELLVVISIIAILAAILFPVFAQAREKARQAACMSNMKQIGMACLQYTQDYDETLIPPMTWTGNAGGLNHYTDWSNYVYPVGNGASGETINCVTEDCFATDEGPLLETALVMPYLKNKAVFRCPSAQMRKVPPSTTRKWTNYTMNNFDYCSDKLYGFRISKPPNPEPNESMQSWHYGGCKDAISPDLKSDGYSVTPAGKPLAWIENPAGTMFIWEHADNLDVCRTEAATALHWETLHSGGFMALFCDGHVRVVQIGQLNLEMFTYWKEPWEK